MTEGFVRLFKISIVVVLLISGLIFVLNNAAKTFEYTEMHNELMKQSTWLILDGGLEGSFPKGTRLAFKEAAQAYPHAFLKVDIQKTSDHQWIVFSDKLLKPLTNIQGLVGHHSFEELKKANFAYSLQREKRENLSLSQLEQLSKIYSFEEFLETYAHMPLVINIVTPHQFDPDSFLKLIKKYKKERTDVIIMSFAAHIAGSLKKQAPLYLYVANTSLFSKAYLLSQFFMEAVGTLNADIFIGPLESKTQPPLSARLVEELKRRKKKIIAITDSWPKGEVRVDGIMTSRPISTHQ